MNTSNSPYLKRDILYSSALAIALLGNTLLVSEALANTTPPKCEKSCGDITKTPQGKLGKYFNKPERLQSIPNEDNILEGGTCKGIEIEWCPIEEKVLKIIEPKALS